MYFIPIILIKVNFATRLKNTCTVMLLYQFTITWQNNSNFFLVGWPLLQKSLMENFIFCAVQHKNLVRFSWKKFCLDLCVKSLRIQSFFGPYFSIFGLNAETYRVNLLISSSVGKYGPEKNLNTETYDAVDG